MEDKTKFMMQDFSWIDKLVDLNEFPKIRQIGHGASANVYSTRDPETNEILAMKLFHDEYISVETQKKFLTEVILQASLQHPTILKIHGFSLPSYKHRQSFGIISELITRDTLRGFFNDKNLRKELTDTRKMKMILGIAVGMEFIHSKGMMHRDLKPSNILIDQNYEPRIADFGFAKYISETMIESSFPSTPLWRAPEIFLNHPYNYKADVYSFGLILNQFFTYTNPYCTYGVNEYQLGTKVVNGERPRIMDSTPHNYVELIRECWAADPNDRPTFADIVSRLMQPDFLLPDVYTPDIDEYKKIIKPEQKQDEKEKVNPHLSDILRQSLPGDIPLKKEIIRSSQYLKDRADEGNGAAQFHYALLLQKDPSTAQQSTEYLQMAAENNHPEALYILSQLPGSNDSELYLKRAALYGHKKALYALFSANQESENKENKEIIKQAAENGCVEAQYLYSHMMKNKNPAISNYFLKKAALKNHPGAQNNYGLYLQKKNKCEKAIHYFMESANQGNQHAQFNLFILLQKSHNADEYCKTAADKGNPLAQYCYGMHLKDKSIKDCKHYLKLSASQGNDKAQYNLARIYKKEKKSKKMKYYYKLAAQKQHFGAQNNLGRMYEDGICCDKNYQRASLLYYLSSQQNNDIAFQNCLKIKDKTWLKIEPTKSLETYIHEARNGVMASNLICAMILHYERKDAEAVEFSKTGIGINDSNADYLHAKILCGLNNRKEAFPFFRKAAKNGHHKAQYHLAYMYQTGTGIEQDSKKAVKYLTKAADNGNTKAQEKLFEALSLHSSSNGNLE